MFGTFIVYPYNFSLSFFSFYRLSRLGLHIYQVTGLRASKAYDLMNDLNIMKCAGSL